MTLTQTRINRFEIFWPKVPRNPSNMFSISDLKPVMPKLSVAPGQQCNRMNQWHPRCSVQGFKVTRLDKRLLDRVTWYQKRQWKAIWTAYQTYAHHYSWWARNAHQGSSMYSKLSPCVLSSSDLIIHNQTSADYSAFIKATAAWHCWPLWQWRHFLHDHLSYAFVWQAMYFGEWVPFEECTWLE